MKLKKPVGGRKVSDTLNTVSHSVIHFNLFKNVDTFDKETLLCVDLKGTQVLLCLCLELFSFVKLNKKDNSRLTILCHTM